jgi:hypothetical protein
MSISAIVSLLLFGQSPLPDTPVTFSTGGATVAAAVAGLAKETNVSLLVSATMRNEILVIHADKVPLGELMKRVASVTEGTWELSGNSWTLVPNRAVREAARAKRRTERMSKLRAEIARQMKPPAKPDQMNEVMLPSFAFGGSSTRVAQLVSPLDLATLADLPESGRIVYSSAPTRMQRAFTPNARLIQDMIAEHNKSARAQPEQVVGDNDADTERAMAWMRRMGLDRRAKVITEPPAKVLLAVQNGGMLGDAMVQAQVKVYDREGNILLAESSTFMIDDVLGSFGGDDEPEEKPKPAPKDDSPKIELTPIGREFSKMMVGMSQAFMGSPAKPSDELKRVASRPQEYEPLGFLVGDYLIQAAKYRKQTLVANLPDDAVENSDALNENTTINQFLKRLETRSQFNQTTEAGFWTLAPVDGERSRADRVNRVALGELLASADAGGSIPLVKMAEFAARSPKFGMRNPLPMFAALLVAPSMLRVGLEPKSWDALALYGSLPAAQRLDLERGTRIPFASMTPAQLVFANRMVYGADPQIQTGADTFGEGDLGGFMGMMMQGFMSGGGDKDFREEPTEIAPNGLQSAGFLSAKVASDYVFQPQGANPLLSMMGMAGAEEVAMMTMFKDAAGSEVGAFMPDLKEFKLGTRKTIRMSLQLAPEAAVRSTLNDDRLPADAPMYTLDNAPAEVKARLDKARESLKKLDIPFLDPGIFQRRSIPPSR